MRKTKTEKGITLIALIITIVVLLILAAVAINSITNDGIISKAERGADKYNKAVKDEQNMLDYYEGYLTGTTGAWTQSGTSVTNGSVTLTVGRDVSGYDGYAGDYSGGWAVLGAENGKLLLVSKVNVSSNLTLGGKDGYNNGIAKLNEMCSAYLNSDLAYEARSIKVEDINRVTGYDPTNQKDGTIYGAGNTYQYGNTVTYTLNSEGNVAYSSDSVSGENGNGVSDLRVTGFEHVDGRKLEKDSEGKSNSIDVKSNFYQYAGSTYLTDTSADAYTVLFGGTDSNFYWVASKCQIASGGTADFALFAVANRADMGGLLRKLF